MKRSSKSLTRIAFLIGVLTLTMPLLGWSGHSERIKLTAETSRTFTHADAKSKELGTASIRVVKGMPGASEHGIDNTIAAQTYTWVGGHADGNWSDQQNWCLPGNVDPREGCLEGTNTIPETGVPDKGDHAVLDGDAGQFNREIYLDKNEIEVGTFTMTLGPNDNPTPFILGSRDRDDGIVNDDGSAYKLTITDRFEWNVGEIRRVAKVETLEHSVVTITGGSLGKNGTQSGFLTINGTGSISGPFAVAYGSRLTVGRNGLLTVNSASPVVVDGGENNTSTFDILGRADITGTGGIDVRTMGAINVSGTLDLRTDAGLSSNCECEMNVSGGGKLVKSGGNGISSIGLKLNNAGTVSATSGTLAFSKTFSQSAGATILDGGTLSLGQSPVNLNGGVLAGRGTVTGNVINASIVRPGYPQSTAGQLTIDGDYTQEPSGHLEIDIGGTAAGRFDRLIVNRLIINETNVNGTTRSGTLDVSLINNFLPTCNESFDVVKYISRQGQFSEVNGIGLGNGRSFTPDYGSGDTVKIVAHGFEGQDTDSDGVTDCADADDDGDGVIDIDDRAPHNRRVCRDVDSDRCDDCSTGSDNPANDGRDGDRDGRCNFGDNCPRIANPAQENYDGDSLGDVCDPDDDNDNQTDEVEVACGSNPRDANSRAADTDGGGLPDCFDPDDDGDGQMDATELECGSNPLDPTSRAPDLEGDNVPDCVDDDDDGDNRKDTQDNCPRDRNTDQRDSDGDGVGDVCDRTPGQAAKKSSGVFSRVIWWLLNLFR